MFRRYRIELIIAFLLGVIVAMGLISVARGATFDAMAHDRADRVLVPAFISAMNDFTMHHETGDANHLRKLDAGDLKRWKAARKAWHDLEEAMGDAGF